MKYKYQLILCSLLLVLWMLPLQSQTRIASLQEPLVVLLDDQNGSIIEPTFIDLSPLSQGTPKALIQVGEELWISDQIEDRIDRFDLSGNYLSTISGGLDNIKGMALVNESEVWVTNAGSNNGAPGDAIVRLDLDGNSLGSFATSGSDSAFDVIDVGGEVYISYINTESKIERRDYSGNVLGNIVEEGVVQFIQQIEYNPLNDSVYAAVFSTTGSNSSGLYEFAVSDGSILNYWDVGNLRGVAALTNGDVLVSNSAGVSILDTGTGGTTSVSTESGQYFGHVDLSPCTTPPTPTGDANQSFGEGATLADIVITPPDVTWFATEDDAINNTNPLPNTTELEDATTYYAVNIVDDCLSEPFAVTITILLGIGDSNQDLIAMYPNPTRGILHLEMASSVDRITVYSLFGQRLMSFIPSQNRTSIDMSSFSVGVYLVEATSEQGVQRKRVIRK